MDVHKESIEIAIAVETRIFVSAVSTRMQSLGRRYMRYFNAMYQSTRMQWEGRYKSSLINSDRYLLTFIRYIEFNPERAGMVEHPGEYTCLSYLVNAWQAKDRLIHHHPIYRQLGTGTDERQASYLELFRHHIDNDTVHEIRAALNQELY